MADTIITTPLPLDLEGVLSSNYIRGEQHTLAAGVNRLIIPRLGCFYSTKDLVVRESITGRVLTPVVDYVPVMYHKEASERSGLETMAAIVVTNQQVDSAITVDLRYVGGKYTSVVDILFELIANLNLDNRTVRWGDLLGKPHAFTPAHHLHDIGDVYGFEYVVEAIDNCTRAVLYGDQAAFDEMRQWVNLKDAEIHARIDDTNANLNSHVNNVNNPHATTKAQVGLGLVQNYGLSTQAQMLGTLQATSYVTPLAMTYYFQTGNGKPITDHLVNTNNPHATTKAQVGLSLVENYTISDAATAIAGVSNTLYMTPLRVKEAITVQAVTPLNAHIARVDNPHATTKAQVGLGLVENYAVATTAEAEAGTVTTKYMTPALVKSAITVQAVTPLNAHIARVDNPHATTKAQVGLGSVENYGIATAAEAIAGALNTEYMTPLRVKDAITAQAVTPLNAHAARTDNPHSVTKAQVGLSVVENYGIATSAEAIAGTLNNEYMTPLRVKEAITAQAVTPLNSHIARTDNPHSVTKAQVGLGNADNTSDVNKPVSTAQQNALNLKVDKVTGYALSKNDFTDALLSKLNGIAAGAQVNVPTNLSYGADGTHGYVYSSTGATAAVLGATTSYAGLISASDKAKLDGIAAGAQVNVATNLSLGTRTAIAVPVLSSTGAGVTLPIVTTTLAGVMSSADKTKLDGIAPGAQVNVATNLGVGTRTTTTVPVTSSTGATAILPVVTTSLAGVMSSTDKSKLDGIAPGAQVNVATNLAQGTRTATTVPVTSSTGASATLDVATPAVAGVMSASDKTKLDGIQAGAQVNVGTNLSVGQSAVDAAVYSSTGNGVNLPRASQSGAGIMSATDKSKLDGIAWGAQANVPTDLSTGASTTDVAVYSSTGADITLPRASSGQAGIITAAYIQKIDSIQAGAQVNVGTNLSVGQSDIDAAVYSSTGNGVNLPRASASGAGIVTAAYIQKIDSIAWGAQVNTVNSVAGKTGNVSLNNADVGLGAVWNYGIASTAQAQAGTSDSAYMTPLKVRQAIEAIGGGGSLQNLNYWGFYIDTRTGMCWNWGITPALTSEQLVRCNFKKPYIGSPFFVNIGPMTYATSGGGANENSEMYISVLAKSINNTYFVAHARRLAGGNYDSVSGAWVALGIATPNQPEATTQYITPSWTTAWTGAPVSGEPGAGGTGGGSSGGGGGGGGGGTVQA